MKIALLTNGIWPYVMGGMQKHSYYLCKYLARKGVYVDLYHTNLQIEYDIQELEFFTKEEKKYIRSFVIEMPKSDRYPGKYLRMLDKYSEAIYNELIKRLNGVDFIYSKGLSAWKLLKEKSNHPSLPPIGINIHGYEMYQRPASFSQFLGQLILRPPFRFINQNADFIFSYGGKITNIISEKLNVSNEKIIEIPTGIESTWISDSKKRLNNRRRFIFLGRYERRKGIEELTTVLKSLVKTHDDFSFDFIGPIPKEKRIDNSQITYHGQLSMQNEIKDLLCQADILVVPSYAEGMPNVILEGMASGCAVIATNVGAINQMVDNETGWLMPKVDTQTIKAVMLEVINISSDTLYEKQLNSISRVKNGFLWDNIIDQHLSFLYGEKVNG